jgi:hypothetical protein
MMNENVELSPNRPEQSSLGGCSRASASSFVPLACFWLYTQPQKDGCSYRVRPFGG